MCISEHLFCLFVDSVLHSTSNLGGDLKLHKPIFGAWMLTNHLECIFLLHLCSFEDS
jgi:hypothetical protein